MMRRLNELSRSVLGLNRRLDVISTSCAGWKQRGFKGTWIIVDQPCTVTQNETTLTLQFESPHGATSGQKLRVYNNSLSADERSITIISTTTIRVPKTDADTLSAQASAKCVIFETLTLSPSKYSYSIVNGMDNESAVIQLNINSHAVNILAHSRLCAYVSPSKTIFYN